MKLTVIFLTAGFLNVSAKGLSQNITFSGQNVSLETVFTSVKKQTGFLFLYNESLLHSAKPVTISATNLPLKEFLDEIFKSQSLRYDIKGKSIFISEKTSSPTHSLSPVDDNFFPPGSIKVRVTNADGQPLDGASISIKNNKIVGLTSAEGLFSVNVSEGDVLVISYVGYQTKEFKITPSLIGSGVLVVALQPNVESLNEVVINKGYYTEKQRYSVGNVTVVKGADIEKQPVGNPLLALQGRVPGLFITQATGLPGSGVTVRIQGQNSISNGNDPLYVIDGVPYASQMLPTISNILGKSGDPLSGAGNPLSFINPADIESISVLKDADATSIYGSRAANGAILITTKKGKAGQTRVNIDLQNGWGKVTRKLDMLSTPQYLEMRHEAFKNDGINPRATDYDINGTWDTTRYTDWQKELIGNTAKYQNVQASVSGGTANTQFLIGTNYHRETTVFPSELSDQKGSVHLNINNSSSNQKFKINLSGSYQFDKNQLINNDLTGAATQLPPDAPALYNSDGSQNWQQLNGKSTWTNPLYTNFQPYQNKTYNLIGNLILSYEILPGLNLKTNFGYTNLRSTEFLPFYPEAKAPEKRATAIRAAYFTNSNTNSWIAEPQITYQHKIGKGLVDILMGSTINKIHSDYQQLAATGFITNLDMADIGSATDVFVSSRGNNDYKYKALFGKFGYNYKNTYIINLTARRDGSSRFGSENQFNNFWSTAGGWIFSNEKFIRDALPFLSFGKLKASFGTTGSDQIGDYQYLNLYSVVYADAAYQGSIGLLPNNLSNPFLQWEETKKLQAGIEIGVFSDRLLLNANFFRNRTSNQLLSYNLPVTTGFVTIAANLPATVQNSGWEFTLTSNNVKTKNFNWTTHFNLAIPKNKLKAFSNLAQSSYASNLVIGKPISIQKMFQLIRVNDTTGIYQFANSKGELIYKPASGDKNFIVNTAPRFYGGFQNEFQYKGFELNILFQFVKQIGNNFFFGRSPGAANNQPIWILDRWQKPGDIASHQKYSATYSTIGIQQGNALSSNAAYSDASYIRLKNLSLSWHLPGAWIRKVHVQNSKIYLQGQNLLTITKYKGLDPETQSITTLPTLRVLTLGLHIEL